MKNTQINSLQNPIDTGYIPLQEFRNHLQQEIESPYHSKFSFSKLIQIFHAKSKSSPNSSLAEPIARLESVELKLRQEAHSWESLSQHEDFEPLMRYLLPSFFFQGQMGFIKGPFEHHQFRYQTEAFRELLVSDRWELKVDAQKFMSANSQNILMAGATVLNTFYKQQAEIHTAEGMTLRDRETKMERHYKFNVQLDYLEVRAVKPVKKLSKKQIHELLNNLYDEQLWLRYIPPENFVFEGFVIGYLSDVTQAEILSTVKEMAANEGGKSGHENDLNYLEILVRSYLDMPDLQFGALQTVQGPWIESLTWCLLRSYESSMMRSSLEDLDSAYGKLMHTEEPFIVEDLQKRKHISALEKALMERGVRSLLLAPLTDDEGRIVSIFELASPKPYCFSQFTLLQLAEFISLFAMGANKFIQEMDNSIRLTLQQEFTSIHPSVEWKFKRVASKYFWEHTVEQQQTRPDPIVFKDVYPLYGQADIVGSSKQRNHSIQADLTENLESLYQVLIACRKAVRFHLFDVYAEKVKAHSERLNEGGFDSSDESVIVELLTEQIHPLLRKLRPRFPQLPQEMLDKYFDSLDPELAIVYRYRKAYENSVSMLNQTISNHLLQEEEKMQQILPHYFEKFQTDGVEYNLYVGQSLLEEGEFHSFYLRDFRLWQLILMCDITRLVEQQSKSFPVPLTTAQLIFVFNSSLSIRFQMDEKKFDVDGAYNVRYEIIKKRIDKAYIKGTDERLTQAGKIAIIWLQEKDRQEYQEYLDHLVHNGYISAEIEDLELEKMQGVEGLKAIRVQVIADKN